MKISTFGSAAFGAGVLVFGLMLVSRGTVNAQASAASFTVVNNNAALDAGRPNLVMTKKNVLMVAFIETVNGVYNAFVKRWNGKTWERLGTSLNVDKNFNSFDVTLRLDHNDSPVVAWPVVRAKFTWRVGREKAGSKLVKAPANPRILRQTTQF
jgi:hypothetical protein